MRCCNVRFWDCIILPKLISNALYTQQKVIYNCNIITFVMHYSHHWCSSMHKHDLTYIIMLPSLSQIIRHHYIYSERRMQSFYFWVNSPFKEITQIIAVLTESNWYTLKYVWATVLMHTTPIKFNVSIRL